MLADRDPALSASIHDALFVWGDQITHLRGERLVAKGAESSSYSISRRHLVKILTERALQLGVRIEYGMNIQDISGLPEADLIVAADGVNSRVRQEAGGFTVHEAAGRNKYIWLGTSKVFRDFHFFFEHTDSGWLWAHAYGIDQETSTFIVECAPETWTGLGLDAMSTPDALRFLEKVFGAYLDGHELTGQFQDGRPTSWLSFRTLTNERWHAGNVVLVGDSAHTTHFTIGMGATLAIMDAGVLADSLHAFADVEQALKEYEKRRKAELVPLQAEAYCSGRWFENVSRYIDRSPRQFAVLLYARRSPLTAMLPPVVSYLLRRSVLRFALLDDLRRRVAPAVKTVYRKRRFA
jgi:2-polyprenyl-6-methoxyphenol hydroxylase-like FAD-dependent oxidoreductase